jgi:hypothetical protein
MEAFLKNYYESINLKKLMNKRYIFNLDLIRKRIPLYNSDLEEKSKRLLVMMSWHR